MLPLDMVQDMSVKERDVLESEIWGCCEERDVSESEIGGCWEDRNVSESEIGGCSKKKEC